MKNTMLRKTVKFDTWKFFSQKDIKKPEKGENFFPLNNELSSFFDDIQDILTPDTIRYGALLVAQLVKNLPAMPETPV